MQKIIDAFLVEGLEIESVELDGKIHRFKADSTDTKKSAWYIGFQNSTRKGDLFHLVLFGNFKLSESYTYTSQVKYSAEDKRFIKAQMEKAQAARDADQKRSWDDTAEEVSKKWETLEIGGSSPYLFRKKIAECYDLGVRYQGTDFYIPVKDIDGKLWSFEKIQEEGGKFFFPGGKIRGHFHTIGDITEGKVLYVCEGFATGVSIRLAMGKAPVVVAFSAGNLLPVVTALKTKYRNKQFIICGDDDRWTKKPDGSFYNPGREKAEEAAKSCHGTAVFPVFDQLVENETKDMNDLHCREGLNLVQAQLSSVAEQEEKEQAYVYALGIDGGNFYYTSSMNKQVVCMTSFSQDNLIKLMPNAYWEKQFPGKGGKDETSIRWRDAASWLASEAASKGLFSSYNIRGCGVWKDQGRIVIHHGKYLLVDGVPTELQDINSSRQYMLSTEIPPIHEKPLTLEECSVLVKACELFKWRNSDSGYLLGGVLVTSRVCGALPIRPHLWLTGEANTGKTTLIERVINPILGTNKISANGTTTEAGIRQSLKASAIPVVYDEFESNGPKSSSMIQAVLDLLRSSWSESDAQVIKGGANGVASAFKISCSAIVSSIRTALITDADKSRFACVELAPHGSDPEHWKQLSALLDQLDGEYSERLFSRTIRLLPILLINYRKLKSAFSQRVSTRFGDQYGMILAGYSVLISDDVLTDAQVEVMIKYIQLEDEKADSKQADHDDCLTELLTKKITIEGNVQGDRKDFSIGEAIKVARIEGNSDSEIIKTSLQRIGIRVELNAVCIATKHSELECQVFRNTRWSQSWARSLLRLPGASKGKQIWMSGKNLRPVVIPMEVFSNS